MDSQPLTPEQLSERWQCSKTLVIRTINEGKLSAFRLGKKHFRIPIEAVKEYEACLVKSNCIEGSGVKSGTRAEKLAAHHLVRQISKKRSGV
ncbi:excisionase family DNA-binding protein [uncultured Cohaesibacter sp.]|uniref:excisionase family DNA-binding protein n=1 Tax=uncultured Cohaesibacter sp. TaxID=1002546 RepID=UPI0037483495